MSEVPSNSTFTPLHANVSVMSTHPLLLAYAIAASAPSLCSLFSYSHHSTRSLYTGSASTSAAMSAHSCISPSVRFRVIHRSEPGLRVPRRGGGRRSATASRIQLPNVTGTSRATRGPGTRSADQCRLVAVTIRGPTLLAGAGRTVSPRVVCTHK